MSEDTRTFGEAAARIRTFVKERDWAKFHSPKDLAVAVSVEAGELLEHFQWAQDNGENAATDAKTRGEIGEEIADVAIYCFIMCDRLGLDLGDLIQRKLEINRRKYPIERARGTAVKHDKL